MEIYNVNGNAFKYTQSLKIRIIRKALVILEERDIYPRAHMNYSSSLCQK